MGAGYVSAWQAALMPSASKLSRCVFFIIRVSAASEYEECRR
ncbi:hypothetical protein CKO_03887 [Citrobacter koseri ATCC BAA-895]|uniref:Uncharacterized protein n=1 Tax=Citrobacter koseri (strain ATCC BAA-895 / CDC 4225-83 / SGSC4696) TaxID=290338 RepID=A8ANA1_CITK8|nr:hypothetical protein CKO_03887 [Citrobacter koseri ATCC BAA-895]